ncbi:granulin a [Betta splendens]|uniref:Granulin a n=1 Tax=Betta splendens TaxID=158456 RepID=A0A6P7N7V2_BETSP|nr:granulin a [Betta splendens]
MQLWVVLCWAVLALVGAHQCPDGRRCEEGQTCCSDPASGFKCCPFDQAECCEDHIHCCPAATLCDVATSSCVNATVSMPWVERTSYSDPRLSKSFRMIKTYIGEDEDNVCPDLSRCPPEFSCLRALTKFGCCPLAHGSPCSDGKHCCPEDHQCSGDSRSCIKRELVTAVPCSDGKSECPQGTTCCETPDGKWGCCPMPKAVCCEDKVHCCPEGTACDIKQSKCISLSTKTAMPMWDKLPARIRAEWENQKGEHMTAEAAADSGSEKTQDTTANTVPPSQEEVSVSSVTKAAGSSDVPCSETVACPENYTCCGSQSGGWSCCPLPKAVCCKDHKGCCPKGKRCNLAKNTCEDDTSAVPMVTKVPAMPRQNVEARTVPCNSTASCPDGTTCCKTKDGGWACCPFPEAVCCNDFLHCCPHGKQCNLAAGTCDGETGVLPWAEKLPVIPRQNVEARNVPCNSTASCPDGTTCCKTKDGGWACCPFPEAVCCNDFLHCCPHGKQCNLAAGTCDGETGVLPWAEKLPVIPRQNVEARNVPCNSTASCPDGTTCCKTKDGGWACCPFPEAVCCNDFLHCCPHGKQCNLAAGTCDGETGALPWAEKLPVIPRQNVEARNVPCNSTASCPDGTTCCKTKDGGWACCPFPEAVCCNDFLHCCPHGKQCNLAAGTCDGETGALPWAEKLPVIPRQNVEARNVPCNSTASCPDGTTCCKTKDGGWACCPFPEAVCCNDFLHCCPHGKQCNLAAGTCDGETGVLPWAEKLPVIPRQNVEARNVPCNSTASCPDGTTCCKTKDGGWACCPFPEAVCCNDFLHCCPHGKQCNLAAGTCDGETGALPWAEKLPVIPRQNVEARNVPCNSTASCPDGTTCCKTKTGDWACCPLPEAVCCNDHEHCCPSGTTCDLTTVTCKGASGSSPMTRKKPAFTTVAPTTVAFSTQKHETGIVVAEQDEKWKEEDEEENTGAHNRVQCDAHTSCPQYTTCCFMVSTHKWGCCPLPQAVCCSDGSHCCPKQYKCDEHKTSCIKGEVVIPWYTKLQATTSADAPPGSEQCGGLNQCPKDTTCCRLKSGEWGCCPMQNAVCCPDQEHCCPKGYTCNMASKSCQKLHVETLLLTPVLLPKQQHQPSPVKSKDVPCDDKTKCRDGQTCCRVSATKWGCCPLPNAVCCSDMKHCCEAGYTCTDTGDCIKNTRFNWFNWHMFRANEKRALVV